MRVRIIHLGIVLAALVLNASAADYVFSPPNGADRFWLGPELWANPMPDWRLEAKRIVCEHPGGNRNVVLLTCELTTNLQPFLIRATLDQLSNTLAPKGGWAGFNVGMQGRFGDYRDSAVSGRGFAAGLHFGGRLFIGDTLDKAAPQIQQPFKDVTLELRGEPATGGFQLTLKALGKDGSELARCSRADVDASWLVGLMAVTISTVNPPEQDLKAPRPGYETIRAAGTQRGGTASVAFRNIKASGGKVAVYPERAFGPVLWTQHSLQNDGTLKMLAQFPPLNKSTPYKATLDLEGRKAVTADIDPASWTALFKLTGVDTARPHAYAVRFNPKGAEKGAFTGRIRPLPSSGKPLTLAALSCNDGTGFPHNGLVANVAMHQPDLLAFLGDQIYESNGGYGVLHTAGERSIIDYLRKYFMHGWTWRDLLRDIPTITIPDDHDVFHGNLWGNGGRATDISRGVWAEAQDSGGYKMPPAFVNVVHRTQAGNLPDPFDSAPCDQGISVYYTSWEFGPLDMAIVADRQWKTAPAPLLQEADIFNGFPRNENWNPRTQASHPDAQLLGERQEKFLKAWASRKQPQPKLRIVLSQTPWNCLGTLPDTQNRSDKIVPNLPIVRPGEYPTNDVPTVDFDSNGWPRERRDLALKILRDADVLLHVAGDQHLGSTGRYGIERWEDGPYWVATPAIANLWPRRWFPREPGANRKADAPPYTGQFEDQFGNKLTLLAAANPRQTERDLPVQIGDRAPGYTIVRFDLQSRSATIENWPYWASPSRNAPDNKPYDGWPITIR